MRRCTVLYMAFVNFSQCMRPCTTFSTCYRAANNGQRPVIFCQVIFCVLTYHFFALFCEYYLLDNILAFYCVKINPTYYCSTELVVWRCSVRKCVLRNSAKFTGKHLCRTLFLNKAAGSLQLYYKRDSSTDVFL